MLRLPNARVQDQRDFNFLVVRLLERLAPSEETLLLRQYIEENDPEERDFERKEEVSHGRIE